MTNFLALLMLCVVVAQAYVIPGGGHGGLGFGNPGFGNPYNDITSLAGGVAGGVASSLSGLGGPLGGLGGPLGGLGGPLGGLGGPLGGLGGPLGGIRGGLGGVGGPLGGLGGPIGGRNIGGFPGAGAYGPQGLSMDYGFLRG